MVAFETFLKWLELLKLAQTVLSITTYFFYCLDATSTLYRIHLSSLPVFYGIFNFLYFYFDNNSLAITKPPTIPDCEPSFGATILILFKSI